MPMKDDLRQAKDAVIALCIVGQKEDQINRCDLSREDAEILVRRLVKRQTRVEVAMAMHMDVRTVDRHYRKAVLILAAVAAQRK